MASAQEIIQFVQETNNVGAVWQQREQTIIDRAHVYGWDNELRAQIRALREAKQPYARLYNLIVQLENARCYRLRVTWSVQDESHDMMRVNKVLQAEFDTDVWFAAFRKGDTSLLEAVDQANATLLASGIFIIMCLDEALATILSSSGPDQVDMYCIARDLTPEEFHRVLEAVK